MAQIAAEEKAAKTRKGLSLFQPNDDVDNNNNNNEHSFYEHARHTTFNMTENMAAQKLKLLVLADVRCRLDLVNELSQEVVGANAFQRSATAGELIDVIILAGRISKLREYYKEKLRRNIQYMTASTGECPRYGIDGAGKDSLKVDGTRSYSYYGSWNMSDENTEGGVWKGGMAVPHLRAADICPAERMDMRARESDVSATLAALESIQCRCLYVLSGENDMGCDPQCLPWKRVYADRSRDGCSSEMAKDGSAFIGHGHVNELYELDDVDEDNSHGGTIETKLDDDQGSAQASKDRKEKDIQDRTAVRREHKVKHSLNHSYAQIHSNGIGCVQLAQHARRVCGEVRSLADRLEVFGVRRRPLDYLTQNDIVGFDVDSHIYAKNNINEDRGQEMESRDTNQIIALSADPVNKNRKLRKGVIAIIQGKKGKEEESSASAQSSDRIPVIYPGSLAEEGRYAIVTVERESTATTAKWSISHVEHRKLLRFRKLQEKRRTE